VATVYTSDRLLALLAGRALDGEAGRQLARLLGAADVARQDGITTLTTDLDFDGLRRLMRVLFTGAALGDGRVTTAFADATGESLDGADLTRTTFVTSIALGPEGRITRVVVSGGGPVEIEGAPRTLEVELRADVLPPPKRGPPPPDLVEGTPQSLSRFEADERAAFAAQTTIATFGGPERR
jgi:hypothetical protein